MVILNTATTILLVILMIILILINSNGYYYYIIYTTYTKLSSFIEGYINKIPLNNTMHGAVSSNVLYNNTSIIHIYN